LSELYEVSCDELDFLVTLAQQEESIAGARMMGGGFGGCTINLIKSNDLEEIYESFSQQYQAVMGKSLKMYVTMPSQGTQLVNLG
jgi:galactokinase